MADFRSMLEVDCANALADRNGNQFTAQGVLLDRIRELIGSIPIDKLPTKDAVLAIAGQLYDQHIAPINIPFIPDVIEPMFDSIAKGLFLRAVGAAYDAIATPRMAI